MLSIIIPVYNAEKYLERCLDSLVKQIKDNVEILLCEDCSKDSSYLICKKYAKKFSYIKVFQNKKNSGVSFTRNNGILHASGDYVTFIDADDYVSDNYIERIFAFMKPKASLIIFGYHNLFTNYSFETRYDNNFEVSYSDFINNYLYDFFENSLIYSVWNKIFKMDILKKNNVLFNNEYKFNEDIIFCLEYLKYAKNVVNINDCLYYYCCDISSSLSKSFDPKSFISLEYMFSLFKKITENNIEYNNIYIKKIYENMAKLSRAHNIKLKEKVKMLSLIRNSDTYLSLKKHYNVYGLTKIIDLLFKLKLYQIIIIMYNAHK